MTASSETSFDDRPCGARRSTPRMLWWFRGDDFAAPLNMVWASALTMEGENTCQN
jgi:hypothetical protein